MIDEIHQAENNIIIFVSHNMEDVANIEDKVMVMDNGKLVLVGTPKEVFSQQERLEAIGLNVPTITRLVSEIRESGVDIRGDILSVKEAEEELYDYLQRKMI